ncbi:hypothetical protein RCL1_007962 [Eukaryota sp. TZLM3-RCL]
MNTCKFPDCSSSISDFKILQVIGTGAHESYYLVIDKEGNRFFMKRINSSSTLSSETLAFLKEVRSPYLVQTHHIFQDEDFVYFLMDYCEGGQLDALPELNSLSSDDIWLICTQLVKALSDLHSHGIVHRNIKLSNILLVSQERPLRVKLANFGIPHDFDLRAVKTTIAPQFMAPEMLSAHSYGAPVDIWALGVLIYFLVEKNYPFESISDLLSVDVPVSNSEFAELISSLLQKDPSKRPTAFQLLKHPKIIEYSRHSLDITTIQDQLLKVELSLHDSSSVAEEKAVELHEEGQGIQEQEIEELRRSLIGNSILMEKVPKLNGEPDWDKFGEVKQLSLSNNKDLTCVEGIQLLTNLTSLHLESTKISDVGPLSSLTNLFGLNLSFTNVSVITSLRSLTKLTTLYLSSTNVSDVSPLSGLTNLTALSLNSTNVRDITSLSSLTNLTTLLLNSTRISDISPLSTLTNLTMLSLRSTSVSDVSALSNMTKLTELNLQSTRISDVTPLSNLTSLTDLNLYATKVSDVSPLRNLTRLTDLHLDTTKVRNSKCLYHIKQLVIYPYACQ